MNILVCGDIHCKPDILKKAVKAHKWDIFIFLGDACDNWGATQKDNLETLKVVADLKEKYGDRFIWLIGNHDWGYYNDHVKMGGHINEHAADVYYFLLGHIKDWEIVYRYENLVFSHAGVSKSYIPASGAVEDINMLKFDDNPYNPLNSVGWGSGGFSPDPSPIWARPEDIGELPEGIINIVGHTPVDSIQNKDGLIICDTMSQYRDLKYIGNRNLLSIDVGEEAYSIDLDGFVTDMVDLVNSGS